MKYGIIVFILIMGTSLYLFSVSRDKKMDAFLAGKEIVFESQHLAIIETFSNKDGFIYDDATNAFINKKENKLYSLNYCSIK